MPKSVAYAGFWKGGAKLQKIWEEQRSELEIVPLKIRPIFRPNLGEKQKKDFSLKLSQISSAMPRLVAQNVPSAWSNFMPNLQRGGACLNFAYFSMQFCNPGDPKGGAMTQWFPH